MNLNINKVLVKQNGEVRELTITDEMLQSLLERKDIQVLGYTKQVFRPRRKDY